MAQQTRKDPRAKVLSMTVRYKSATLDEFIEHHSHDVSCGGMFIKTPQPFPPGTLLKFEVRIAGDRKVMQGVGRVVWKRELQLADAERPAGMGVKFIKLDEESRHVIDQLVSSRKGDTSAYESEGEGTGVDAEATVGLGTEPIAPASKPPGESFFPKTEPAELPPPEDRTVMKQAAELLEEALREVGTDTAPAASKEPPLAPAGDAEERENTRPGRPSISGESPGGRLSKPSPPPRARMTSSGERLGRSTSMNAPSATERAAVAREITEKAREAVESKPAPARPLVTPSGRPLANSLNAPKISIKAVPAVLSAAPARANGSASGGKTRVWVWIGAVVVCAAGTWWLWRPRVAETPATSVQEPSAATPAVVPADQVEPPQEAQPSATVEAAQPPPASTEVTPPAPAAATAGVQQPSAVATASANAVAPSTVPAAGAVTPDSAKVPAKAPARPKPKPAAPQPGEDTPTPAPAEEAPSPAPPAPAAVPAQEKPVEPPPAAAAPTPEAPKPPPTPAPAPAPVKRAAPAPESDNPY